MTLYIVHMGLKFLFYLFYIQIFISVLFFIYRRGSSFFLIFLFIDFYLWRVIKKRSSSEFILKRTELETVRPLLFLFKT